MHDDLQYPINIEFSDVSECIDYIVPFVVCKKIVKVYLDNLITDKGHVVRNMPIFRYDLVLDETSNCEVTLKDLEFRDGKDYDYLMINKVHGWVTCRNIGLGTLTSIRLLVEILNECDLPNESSAHCEHELKPLIL